ncbi:MAG: hypothetical protein KGK07_12990 [Chloroflexota bacterium]|nr:hypothetical protein [Chloroflexota bacterium]
MAIELTRRSLRGAFSGDRAPLRVPARVLVAVVAGVIAASFAAVLVSAQHSRQDEGNAARRLADVRTLLALPPQDLATLRAQVDSARAQIALLKAEGDAAAAAGAVSDEDIALVVRQAQASGLTVRAVARVAAASVTIAGAAYAVDGVRVSVDGNAMELLMLLRGVQQARGWLVPTLYSLTTDNAGVTHADIGFGVYRSAAAATPHPEGTPGAP